MPKLPQVLATEGVAVARGPRRPYVDDNTAGVVLAGSQAVSQTLFDFAALERDKKNAAVRQEVIRMAADTELAIDAGDSKLRLTERDPDKYLQKFDAMVQEITANASKGATYPESGAALSAALAKPVAHRRAAAFGHHNTLYIGRSKSDYDTSLDTIGQLAGVAPTDEAFTAKIKEGEAARNAAAAVIGMDAANDKFRQWRDSTLSARALREANETPSTFLDTADTRFGVGGIGTLPAGRREELKETARNKEESNRKSRNAEWEAYYKRIEEDAETERKSQLTGIRAEARSGRYTIAKLDDAKAMRIVQTPEEYDAIYKVVTEPIKTPSDPGILLDVQLRARATPPRITLAALNAYRVAGKLNDHDWKENSDKVQQRLDFLDNKRDEKAMREQNQAEQMLRAALDLGASPQDKWDPEDTQLHNMALDELTARATAFGGKEDALTVVRELEEKYFPLRLARIKIKIGQYRATLPVEVQSLTAKESMTRLDKARKTGQYGQELYDVYRRTILKMGLVEEFEAKKAKQAAERSQ